MSAVCTRGHLIPDGKLACPMCVEAAGEAAMRRMQQQYLQKAIHGEFGYFLRVAKAKPRHVIQFNSTRTFCGMQLDVQPKITHEPYTTAVLDQVCGGCRFGIAQALSEGPVG